MAALVVKHSLSAAALLPKMKKSYDLHGTVDSFGACLLGFHSLANVSASSICAGVISEARNALSFSLSLCWLGNLAFQTAARFAHLWACT